MLRPSAGAAHRRSRSHTPTATEKMPLAFPRATPCGDVVGRNDEFYGEGERKGKEKSDGRSKIYLLPSTAITKSAAAEFVH